MTAVTATKIKSKSENFVNRDIKKIMSVKFKNLFIKYI